MLDSSQKAEFILVSMDKIGEITGRNGDKELYLIRLNLAKVTIYTGTYITTLQWRFRLSDCGTGFAIFIRFSRIGSDFSLATERLRSVVPCSGNSSELCNH